MKCISRQVELRKEKLCDNNKKIMTPHKSTETRAWGLSFKRFLEITDNAKYWASETKIFN